MLNKLTLIMYCLTAVCSVSCISSKKLHKGLTEGQSTLEYIYDSDQFTLDKHDTIGVAMPALTDPRFTNTGELIKTKASAIPLIFYTGWKSEHEYHIGQDVIREDVSAFTQYALINELNRSSMVHAALPTNNDLILEIEIDSLHAFGPYRSSGYVIYYVFGYSYSMGESAGPGMAYSTITYKLKKRGKIMLEGHVSSTMGTEPLLNTYADTKLMKRHFTSSLTEALSETLKSNIEKIVAEINDYYLQKR